MKSPVHYHSDSIISYVVVTDEEYFIDFPQCRDNNRMMSCTVSYTYPTISSKYVKKVYTPDEDYFHLLDVCIPEYITEQSGYTIYAGSTYYVPPEYSGLAQKVMKKQRGLQQ